MGTLIDVAVRPMTPDDLDEVVSLEAANQPAPWSRAVFGAELAADNRVYLVVVVDEAVAGFGGIMVVGDEAHVTNLLVAPELRRLGLGRRLMVALVDAAVVAGARHLTLEVRASNRAARALYARLGLAPVGIRPGYYGEEDALILWVHDIDDPGYRAGLEGAG